MTTAAPDAPAPPTPTPADGSTARPLIGPAPTSSASPTTDVVLVSAHGGSGASTLAAHLPETYREVDLTPVAVHGTADCVVVAAATVDGVIAATHAVRRLTSVSSAPAIHLALVRDGRGQEPLGARARVRALSVFVASITEVPHVQRWRYEAHDQRGPSTAYAKAVTRLVTAVEPAPVATSRAQRRQQKGATS
ncbi:hypothetical protein [Quadrisphaera sp. INWT6]|uniref:hypothetical protein n=1 Tax=Quadrisphaera sp. INWT6 TaxID=2596917 RepID=UPI0018926540|nr:hypothetical protein [Quadrisphaera sp. INWT6]MBF5083058.1 hypothetical protein [Quadrisphaera sp. INWT6]